MYISETFDWKFFLRLFEIKNLQNTISSFRDGLSKQLVFNMDLSEESFVTLTR